MKSKVTGRQEKKNSLKKDFYLAVLTSTGLFPNSYVDDLVNCEVTLEDIV